MHNGRKSWIPLALFKFKPTVSEQEVQDIFRKVIADIPKVPELKSVQAGVNTSDRSNGYTYGKNTCLCK